jgi:LPS export ABC transporter protein LptC
VNINIFFIGISLGLLMIFIGFKPLNIKQQEFVDVPLFQLETFVVHELKKEGLVTLMKGSHATRYNDRYKVINMDYTDNSKIYLANMRANNGIYRDKEDTVELHGNVVYNREDGLMFESEEANYNKKTSIAKTNKNYVMHRDANRVIGTSLEYNNVLNEVKSKNIVAKYQIKER